MISSSRICEGEGTEQGEYLSLLPLSAKEFILTVVEPAGYIDSQTASMVLTRTQMHKFISSALIALYETADQTGD